jgi:hypothetical protein
MDTQNITLSVPKKILGKFKELAFRQHKSVSSLMVDMMKEKVEQEEGYRLASERHQRKLVGRIDLQTQGKVGWTRDDLHKP